MPDYIYNLDDLFDSSYVAGQTKGQTLYNGQYNSIQSSDAYSVYFKEHFFTTYYYNYFAKYVFTQKEAFNLGNIYFCFEIKHSARNADLTYLKWGTTNPSDSNNSVYKKQIIINDYTILLPVPESFFQTGEIDVIGGVVPFNDLLELKGVFYSDSLDENFEVNHKPEPQEPEPQEPEPQEPDPVQPGGNDEEENNNASVSGNNYTYITYVNNDIPFKDAKLKDLDVDSVVLIAIFIVVAFRLLVEFVKELF